MKVKVTGLNVRTVYEPLLEAIEQYSDKYHSMVGANLSFIIPASVDLVTWANDSTWLTDDPIELLVSSGLPRDVARGEYLATIERLGNKIESVLNQFEDAHLVDATIASNYHLVVVIR